MNLSVKFNFLVSLFFNSVDFSFSYVLHVAILFYVRNVSLFLALREISPTTKYVPRRQWGEASGSSARGSRIESLRDIKHGLFSWWAVRI